MPSREVETLCKRLVKERITEQIHIDSALRELGPTASVNSLLKKMELRGTLTSYQTGKIAKGEWDGLVLGHFRLMYRNAAGSFARVYRAVDLRTGKMVGLKLLRQRWASDPQAVKDFIREAEMCQNLKHENIVPIYEIGRSGDAQYFTMEFVEGGNLKDFLNIRKKLSPKEATKCVLDIAQGLQYALGKGVTHRDMKLTNVLMSFSGVAKLVDFGLGGGPAEDGTDLSESLARAIEYATLERNTGAPRNDPRSDMYFLGVIYYELLTGTPPYERTKDRSERGTFARYQNVRPVQQADPSLPASVCRICDRLMQLNPMLRYQTPGDAVPDLEAAIRQEAAGPVAASASTPTPEAASSEPAQSVPPGAARPAQPVILFIEDRSKHQDKLRDYFTKHKFRVLVVGDLQRGLNRLKLGPAPDALVIMAESAGDDSRRAFRDLQQSSPQQPTFLVLSTKQTDWAERLKESDKARVLTQPMTLRDLRKTVEKVTGCRSDDAKAGDDDAE